MTTYNLSQADERLLTLLRDDARASISELARKLSLSRSTVQSRLNKLEQSGVISGYRVELSEQFRAQQVEAHVLIKLVQKLTHSTERALHQIPNIVQLLSVSGEYDLIAMVEAESLQQLSSILDDISALSGVERTTSSVVLEARLRR
ncbi:Regulatory protein AsnC [Thalassocella blandensis]|nr:Regulatory protein AsnC [Thalassocella blandensis]